MFVYLYISVLGKSVFVRQRKLTQKLTKDRLGICGNRDNTKTRKMRTKQNMGTPRKLNMMQSIIQWNVKSTDPQRTEETYIVSARCKHKHDKYHGSDVKT
jgi:hypothetical protein